MNAFFKGASASIQATVNKEIDNAIARNCLLVEANSPSSESTSRFSGRSLPKLTSMRSMAIRHHSRQENGYIHWHDMMSVSLGRKLSAQSSSSGSSRHNSQGSFGRKNSSHVSLGDVVDVKTTNDPSSNVVGGKKKLNLRINIQDDQDWIQVQI